MAHFGLPRVSLVLALTSLGLAGCPDSHGTGDLDGGGGAGDAPSLGTCTPSPVTGTYVELRGSGEALATFGTPMSYGEITEGVGIYLPDGTDDGDRVVVTHSVSWPFGGLSVSISTLSGGRADIAAGGSYGSADFSVSGTFDVATGTATVTATRNFAMPSSDVALQGEASMVLCTVGTTAPAPALTLMAGSLLPTQTFHLVPSVPIAIEADVGLGEQILVRVLAGDVEVPVTIRQDAGGAYLVTPVNAYPPGVALSIEVEATDALGRAVTIAPTAVTVPVTTATVTDLTFDTAPPAGALTGMAASWADGAIGVGSTGFPGTEATLLLAFDAPLGTTTAHLDLGACVYGARIAIVGPDGERADGGTAVCEGGTARLDVALPVTGPSWLVVDTWRETPNRPQWLWGAPPPGFSILGITLD